MASTPSPPAVKSYRCSYEDPKPLFFKESQGAGISGLRRSSEGEGYRQERQKSQLAKGDDFLAFSNAGKLEDGEYMEMAENSGPSGSSALSRPTSMVPLLESGRSSPTSFLYSPQGAPAPKQRPSISSHSMQTASAYGSPQSGQQSAMIAQSSPPAGQASPHDPRPPALPVRVASSPAVRSYSAPASPKASAKVKANHRFAAGAVDDHSARLRQNSTGEASQVTAREKRKRSGEAMLPVAAPRDRSPAPLPRQI